MFLRYEWKKKITDAGNYIILDLVCYFTQIKITLHIAQHVLKTPKLHLSGRIIVNKGQCCAYLTANRL